MVRMAIKRIERRTDALSKERIVEAAIDILDSDGESALTFRALAARLATGAGAIYWHVADKDELLAAATNDIIARAMAGVTAGAEPREAIRVIALGLFDAIDAHPWAGTRLSREPFEPAMLLVSEGIGGRLLALGVPEQQRFNAWSVLISYIVGAAGQNAANARRLPPETDRSAFLGSVAAQWARLDPEHYPFMRQLATPLREHDDREQFLAGIDLILAGIATLR